LNDLDAVPWPAWDILKPELPADAASIAGQTPAGGAGVEQPRLSLRLSILYDHLDVRAAVATRRVEDVVAEMKTWPIAIASPSFTWKTTIRRSSASIS
jgi:hypothetical protein